MIPKEKPRWIVYAAVKELGDLVIVDYFVDGKNENTAINNALKNNKDFRRNYTVESWYALKIMEE